MSAIRIFRSRRFTAPYDRAEAVTGPAMRETRWRACTAIRADNGYPQGAGRLGRANPPAVKIAAPHAEMRKTPLYRANFLHFRDEMAEQIFDTVPQRRRR
jgi:hypothetical protein